MHIKILDDVCLGNGIDAIKDEVHKVENWLGHQLISSGKAIEHNEEEEDA